MTRIIIILSVIACMVSGAFFIGTQYGRGIEIKKQAQALSEAVARANKISEELRQYRENVSKKAKEVETKIVYLPGIKRDEKAKCPSDAALVDLIGLRRSINAEISKMRVQ